MAENKDIEAITAFGRNELLQQAVAVLPRAHTMTKNRKDQNKNNQSLRARLGIDDKSCPMASRIIKDALDAKVIKEENLFGGSRHNYVPYWA